MNIVYLVERLSLPLEESGRRKELRYQTENKSCFKEVYMNKVNDYLDNENN